MKKRIATLAALAIVAVLMAVVTLAVVRPGATRSIAQLLGATRIVSPSSLPTQSPSPAYDAGTGVTTDSSPTPTPNYVPPSPRPVEAFPPAPTPTTAAPGNPAPPAIPQTMVSVGIQSNTNVVRLVDVDTGGPECHVATPCTIVWAACFQGGFTGLTVQTCGQPLSGVTFTWSNGHTGPTDSVTYSSAGTFTVKVSVIEVYQGHIYGAGSANAVPVLVD